MHETKKFLSKHFDMKDLDETLYVLGDNMVWKNINQEIPLLLKEISSVLISAQKQNSKIRNTSDSICFHNRKSYIYSSVYMSGYYVYHINVWLLSQ
jgi:hypothetical protein